MGLFRDTERKVKFERLYEDYHPIMYSVAYRLVENSHSAEDIVHEAFMRVLCNLDKIGKVDSPQTRSFLVVITEHIAIDWIRKCKKEQWISYEERVDLQNCRELSYEQTDDKVVEAMMKLPLKYSVVLKLKYVLGYDNSEISKILQITEESIRQRISRGKKMLSTLLQEEQE